jgi:hypothetical protein
MDDLLAIAAQAAIGPLRVGQSFSETLRILGTPQHLSFPYDEMFDGTLSYGPADIFVRIIDNNVSSYLIQLHLFRRSTGPYLHISDRISILRPTRFELSYDRVRDALVDARISFKTNSLQDREMGMHPLMQFNDAVRFYFLPFGRQKGLQLSYIELGDFCGPP